MYIVTKPKRLKIRPKKTSTLKEQHDNGYRNDKKCISIIALLKKWSDPLIRFPLM